jgi:hypothetical protein
MPRRELHSTLVLERRPSLDQVQIIYSQAENVLSKRTNTTS